MCQQCVLEGVKCNKSIVLEGNVPAVCAGIKALCWRGMCQQCAGGSEM